MSDLPSVRGSFSWRVHEPTDTGDRETVLTENQVLAAYYPYWVRQMVLANAQPITPLECLRDWVVVQWAEKV